MERLQLSQFPDETRDCACDRIAMHTVGLCRNFKVGKGENSKLIGTGTLVTIGTLHCILTAEHVLRELRSQDRLSLMTSFTGDARLHAFEQLHLQIHRIARGLNDAAGPDIGLIVLPKDNIGFLRSEKSFYNLDKRISQFAAGYLPKDQGFWFTCGVLGETETELPPTAHFAKVGGYMAHCGAAANPDEETDEKHDYLEIRVPYPESASELPNSFGGLSGGGLWQVTMVRNKFGKIEPVEYVLSGVIFYQTAIENGLRRLRCHGRKTVHEAVPEYVRATCSGASEETPS